MTKILFLVILRISKFRYFWNINMETLTTNEDTMSESRSNGPILSRFIKLNENRQKVKESLTIVKRKFYEDIRDNHDLLKFVQFVPRISALEFIKERGTKVLNGKNKDSNNYKKYTLVLDLDETLVHSFVRNEKPKSITQVTNINGDSMENRYDWNIKLNDGYTNFDVFVRKRPFVDEFLKEMSKYFELIIFTASEQSYADKVIDKLDPTKRLISHRLYRDSCIYKFGGYIKDLRVLNRDLNKTIIIDNSLASFVYQISNGIPVRSWYESLNDKELLNIKIILIKLKEYNDIKPKLKKWLYSDNFFKNI